MKSIISRHPVASYFIAAFAVSWGGIFAVIGTDPFPATPANAERLFVFVYVAMLLGPGLCGPAFTALVDGRAGLRDYRSRLARWHVSPRWYALALLTAPFALTAALLAVSLASSSFTPSIVAVQEGAVSGTVSASSVSSLLIQAIFIGLGAGFFEELGWTGFAIQRMSARRGWIATGVIVGLLWGLWHLLAIWWGSATGFASASKPLYLTVALFSFLPPYRVLMLWVYRHTESLLVAIIMHASLTTSMLLLSPTVTGNYAIVFNLVFAGVLWALVGIVWWLSGLPERATTTGHSASQGRFTQAR